jgi:hypothetical protein
MAQQRENVLTARVTNQGYATVETLRVEYGISQSMVVRAMLAVAKNHLREVRTILEGWTSS